MYEEREHSRRGKVTGNGTLFLNARSSIIRTLPDLDLRDPDIREVLFAIYHNALMLGSQGGKTGLSSATARTIFEANNRTINNLMGKIREVRDLKNQVRSASPQKQTPPARTAVAEPVAPSQTQTAQTDHVTCFVAIPFTPEYDILLESLRDVLEVRPYYWEVARADAKAFDRRVSENVAKWIARAHCYVVEISEVKGNVMMELGHAYWGYPTRPLLMLQRKGAPPDLIDLADHMRINYPWDDKPDRAMIAAALRKDIEGNQELSGLRREGMPRFLSSRLMSGAGVDEQVRMRVAKLCQTVEKFLAEDPNKVAEKIQVPQGIVEVLQTVVRDRVAE